jgi:hypothetical protein
MEQLISGSSIHVRLAGNADAHHSPMRNPGSIRTLHSLGNSIQIAAERPGQSHSLGIDLQVVSNDR